MVWLHNPYVQGAIKGFVAAAIVDYHAFLQFHSWNDVASFDWKQASFRWFQGIVAGAATTLMLPGVV